MRRHRPEEVASRPEVPAGLLTTSLGQATLLTTAGPYVRGIPAPVTLHQGRVGGHQGVLGGCTITSVGHAGLQDLQPVSHSVVSSVNKSEMHTGVHHSMPSYTATLPSSNIQQNNLGVVDSSGRSLITPSQVCQLNNQGGHPPPLPVLQHATVPVHPSAQVRQRTLLGAPTGGGVLPASIISSASGPVAMAACAVGPAGQATPGQVTGQFQRLGVEDALSYLDQVKLRFGRQPEVYNNFLDIMKEFKSQSIDTPGVIARVSQLFSGHPELIVGFNTFLPPGYKIEVTVSVPGQQMTVVHTPQGIHHVTPAHHTGVTTVSMPPNNQHNNQAMGGAVKVPQPVHPGLPRPTNLSVSSHPAIASVVNPSPALQPQPVPSPGISTVPTMGSLMSAVQHPHPSLHTLGSVVLSSVDVGSIIGPLGSGSGPDRGQNNQGHGTPGSRTSSHGSSTPGSVAQHGAGGLHAAHHIPPAQPVEFNHAIEYVNKIKHRFQGQPDTYKQFLEILHTYQKEQKYIKEGGSFPTRTLTEGEVYEKVARLFENQDDLLQEFGQFLPDATSSTAAQDAVFAATSQDFMDQCRSSSQMSLSKPVGEHINKKQKTCQNQSNATNMLSLSPSTNASPPSNNAPPTSLPQTPPSANITHSTSPHHPALKRQHSGSGSSPTGMGTTHHGSVIHSQPPVKKPKLSFLKDMSAAEAGKHATLAEYAFFDKVNKALRHEETYCNFLRCVTLYNEEIISRTELVQLIHPFLTKFPDLLKWFKDFVGCKDGATPNIEVIPERIQMQERITGDLAMEIDYTTCKRLGASYCALPKSHPQPKCSGRSPLCKDVLNDTWVSFPSWSEDSTFVTSRKTQYEEYIYRCEDERFELDVVLETNLATMRVLEGVQKKLQRMSPEEAARFRLDDCLGGRSPTIHQGAIGRIYGEKAIDIIDGLRKNPVVAVPLVLRRLKAKDEEWREAQKGFNKIWREQNEKYYIKSLDHQGLTFKQNDVKMIRSKALLNEVETLYDERHEHMEEGGEVFSGPHMMLPYKDKALMDDAANLIIHHVKRQTTIHKDDKGKIKQLVRQFMPDMFFHPRMEMSDDEKDVEDDDEIDAIKVEKCSGGKTVSSTSNNNSGSEKDGPRDSSSSNNKRKTRSAKTSDSEKESELNTSKKEKDDRDCKEGVIGSTNGVTTKLKEEKSSCKVTLNGDASEAEKNAMKSENVDVKNEPKSEPPSPGDNKPFTTAMSSLTDDEYRLFYGNNNWYLFLRLHQILCLRLTVMYDHSLKIATEESKEKKERKESTAIALRLKPRNEIPTEDYYPALLDMIKNVLDGNMESTSYEDTLREMYGIHAYTAFTLDKVVNGAVRQLQHIICDDIPSQCTSMFITEAKKGGSGGPCASIHRRLPFEISHQRKAEKIMEDENCFKIFTYKRDCRITIELIDTDVEEPDGGGDVCVGGSNSGLPVMSNAGIGVGTTASTGIVGLPSTLVFSTSSSIASSTGATGGGSSIGVEADTLDEEAEHSSALSEFCVQTVHPMVAPVVPPSVIDSERWSDYVERYVTSMTSEVTPAMQVLLSKKPVFLPRNLRSWKNASKHLEMSNKEQGCAALSTASLQNSTVDPLEISDNTQCKFNLSNFKMVFVVNSDSYMYKKDALKRAKESHKKVSQHMFKGISRWHKKWAASHVNTDQSAYVESWFMGECSGLKSNKTVRVDLNYQSRQPFRFFQKYKCTILPPVVPPIVNTNKNTFKDKLKENKECKDKVIKENKDANNKIIKETKDKMVKEIKEIKDKAIKDNNKDAKEKVSKENKEVAKDIIKDIVKPKDSKERPVKHDNVKEITAKTNVNNSSKETSVSLTMGSSSSGSPSS